MFAEGEAGNVSAVIVRRVDYMSFPYFYGRAVESVLILLHIEAGVRQRERYRID